MVRLLCAVTFLAVFAYAPLASAASIRVDGLPGADGVGDAQPGGAGEDANAISRSSDPANGASAFGGAGGTGSASGADPSEVGGAGGAGGSAYAEATAFGDGLFGIPGQASTSAVGGRGGSGGPGVAEGGPGGDGGDAHGRSTAFGGSAPSAIATSYVTGGAGGSANPGLVPGRSGDGGDARAEAEASGYGPAAADASAVAGLPGPSIHTSLSGTDLYGPMGAEGGADATATATSVAETAIATSEARGNHDLAGGDPALAGLITARAHAVSEGADATAIANVFAPDGYAGVLGGSVSSAFVVQSGTAGADIEHIDAVSGSSPTILGLYQLASGGDGGAGSGGGSAISELTATNPGGGGLSAVALAAGGAGGTFAPAPGGDALARVTATVVSGALVDARATATGGRGGVDRSESDFGYSNRISGGNASAHASAIGTELVTAVATAESPGGLSLDAQAHALGSGVVAAARTSLSLVDPETHPLSDFDADFVTVELNDRSLTAEARLGHDVDVASPTLPGPGAGTALWNGAPGGVSGVAGTSLAAAHDVLAVGALGGRALPGDGWQLQGRHEIDLVGASLGVDERLALAFFSPEAFGEDISLLQLTLRADDAVVFELSFTDSASALAALTDALFPLDGVDLGDTTLALDWTLGLPLQGREFGTSYAPEQTSGFGVGAALLIVPEPGVLVLLALALVGLAFAQRAARTTR